MSRVWQAVQVGVGRDAGVGGAGGERQVEVEEAAVSLGWGGGAAVVGGLRREEGTRRGRSWERRLHGDRGAQVHTGEIDFGGWVEDFSPFIFFSFFIGVGRRTGVDDTRLTIIVTTQQPFFRDIYSFSHNVANRSGMF